MFLDFGEFGLRVQNSVHAERAGSRPKRGLGVGWGQARQDMLCQGDLETRCGILDASVGNSLPFVAPPLRGFYFVDICPQSLGATS